MGSKTKHRGKPQGVNYAQQLAYKRRMMQAVQDAACDNMVQVKADMAAQKMLWMVCAAMNDAWGVGAERFKQFAEALQQRREWHERLCKEADLEYADEKLRLEAQRVSGMEIGYLYEEDIQRAKAHYDAHATNYQRIRMMSAGQMARFIVDELLGLSEERAESAEGAWLKWLEEEAKHDEQRGD